MKKFRKCFVIASIVAAAAFLAVASTLMSAGAVSNVSNAAAGTVARLSVFSAHGPGSSSSGSSSGGGFNVGHSFIVVENLSAGSIVVGKMSVPVDKTVSIGKWPDKGGPDKAVIYNYESYLLQSGDYNGRVSLTMDLTASQLNVLCDEINYWEEGYNFINNNCSTFAKETWNQVSSRDIESTIWYSFGVNTPEILKWSIQDYSEHETNRNFDYYDNVGYFDGNNFVSQNPALLSITLDI